MSGPLFEPPAGFADSDIPFLNIQARRVFNGVHRRNPFAEELELQTHTEGKGRGLARVWSGVGSRCCSLVVNV